ncbi:hypothetical protein TNCV_388351 [Trichonephila clavipes]|nr:hypothetical protein TNCV_388351 [Trichonephila clavipes]
MEDIDSFDQVSKFERGRILAHRDYRLSFRENGQCVGQNQATVDADLSSLDAAGNDGRIGPIAPISLHHCP